MTPARPARRGSRSVPTVFVAPALGEAILQRNIATVAARRPAPAGGVTSLWPPLHERYERAWLRHRPSQARPTAVGWQARKRHARAGCWGAAAAAGATIVDKCPRRHSSVQLRRRILGWC